jgi:hypothetical protein
MKCNRNNGILIRSWTGDKTDKVLKDLYVVLKNIASKNVSDIRL